MYSVAASVMYEYSCKLRAEISGIKGLQGQAKCLLAAMNALKLGDAKYAYILRQRMKTFGQDDDNDDDDEDDTDSDEMSASPPKRSRPVQQSNKVSAFYLTFYLFFLLAICYFFHLVPYTR